MNLNSLLTVEIPYGFIENNMLHRNAIGDVPALKLSEFTEDQLDHLVLKMIANFEKLKAKTEKTFEKIDLTPNKGSFFSGLLTLKKSIATHQGLGDYSSLLERIKGYESMLLDYVAKNRQKNTDIKQALLLELEAILANNDMVEAFEQIKDLKARWIKTGSPNEEIADSLEAKFTEGIDGFFEKRKSFLEAKNLLKTARVEDYQGIIDQIATFVKKKNYKNSLNKVKELQKEWKEAGRIPEDEFKKLNGDYWKICQQYFDQLKIFRATDKKAKSGNEKEVMAARLGIIEKLKALADRCLENVQKEFNAIKVEWKSAGSLPKNKFSELQTEFNKICDTIHEQHFVLQMATKKNKGFDQKSDKEKYKLTMQVIKNLLRRDKDELASFSENMGNMHINKGSFVDMLESKLKGQERKVEKKQALLKEYKSKLDSLN